MSTEGSQAGQEQPAWNAPEYERALAHLDKLQEQLDSLRSAIPSQVAPLLRTGTPRHQMHQESYKAAIKSTEDLKDVRADWNSEQTQQMFARARESVQKDGDLSKANEVAKYGWA
ncbi:hypothetical protein KC343_g11865 [Hortaea werneckii]|uniref:Uncharacterized protein n=1 Tax=Hortaea werneckii TaxID=91943 RepID=A0A3M7F6Y2_HORWE|nr:hypothetical protein KC338_g430 [Hortaea werneckii]KAI7134319.1 hypothetical protein KC352_g30748 [Hortaea werneckii]KAI7358584.1 hypothetical protein KC320_g996 [Hortaea werneckii]KAI7556602.1 hypothetical protein KC317_g12159 [Hortaea werneckii]KAI7603242.1 hypothetical protein KC346_g11969 [Hortaea werneckii]